MRCSLENTGNAFDLVGAFEAVCNKERRGWEAFLSFS